MFKKGPGSVLLIYSLYLHDSPMLHFPRSKRIGILKSVELKLRNRLSYSLHLCSVCEEDFCS